MTDFNFKESYNFYDLVEIMALLRRPGGCPWDREQTHESIKKNLIEETYEVIEAINKKSPDMLCEELGDLLMQAVFHAQMESESGSFDIDDVADGICKKLIVRHPHIFGDDKASSVEEVLTNWDEIKMKTKGQKSFSSSINSVPRELPALMRSEKIQKKARDAGLDFDSLTATLEKTEEEMKELKAAIENSDRENIEEEIGDLLFSTVNVSRFLHIDPEEALTKSTDKFAKRFALLEEMAAERGVDMKKASLEELDEIWNEVKKSEAR